MQRWNNMSDMNPKNFKCKYCDKEVSNRLGYCRSNCEWKIYICPHCARPTFFENSKQNPAPLLGNEVEKLPEEIKTLYNEIRDCTGINAYTSAVLSCRKLLMHMAVEQGAVEGKKFIEYVDFLADKGFVPPNGQEWVDHIRKKGNEANHEIVFIQKDDALDLMNFIEMLLKFVYEFPGRIGKKSNENSK